MQDGGRKHHRKDRDGGVSERSNADRADTDAGDNALGAGGVNKCAARHLADQGGKAGRRQDEADVDLRPLLRGEVDRNKGAEARLHVGDKKDEPIKSAQAARRGVRRWSAAVRLFVRRLARRGDAASLIFPFAESA